MVVYDKMSEKEKSSADSDEDICSVCSGKYERELEKSRKFFKKFEDWAKKTTKEDESTIKYYREILEKIETKRKYCDDLVKNRRSN